MLDPARNHARSSLRNQADSTSNKDMKDIRISQTRMETQISELKNLIVGLQLRRPTSQNIRDYMSAPEEPVIADMPQQPEIPLLPQQLEIPIQPRPEIEPQQVEGPLYHAQFIINHNHQALPRHVARNANVILIPSLL